MVTDSELSEGAEVWFAGLIDAAERTPNVDLKASLSPYQSSIASFMNSDGAQLPEDPEDLVPGQVYPLPTPKPAPKSMPRRTMKSYTLASMVNHNPCLQRLVDIGVDLSQLEVKHNAADVLIRAGWDRDILPRIEFLLKLGLPTEKLGPYITKNPWIFQQKVDDLEARVNYLVSKNFNGDAIIAVITKAVFWLNFDVTTIDTRLGWLQKEFQLTGNEVRHVVSTAPKLITIGIGHVQVLEFVFHDEFGFTGSECKQILVKAPRVWLRDRKNLTATFDYLHHELKFSHSRLLTFPGALRYSKYYVAQRHGFLEQVGRAQYDTEKPGYVSLEKLLTGSDWLFCRDVAKAGLREFNEFQKTL